MTRALLSLLCLWVLSAADSEGQSKFRTDSLVTVLENESSDSARCRIMLEIAAEYRYADTALAHLYLNRVNQLASDLPDKSYLGRSYEILGEMHTHSGMYDQAILDYDRALAFYTEADHLEGYYETLKDKGNVHLLRAEYPLALNCYETALDFYRRNDLVYGASRCLNNMGIIYKNRGQYVEALEVYEESIRIIDPEKDPLQTAQGYINMGNVFVYLGSYDQAMDHYGRALDLAERAGSEKETALCLQNMGVVQNKCYHFPEACELYERAMKLGRSMADPVLVSNCLINIGTNYSDMGRMEEGLDYVERGMDMKVRLGDERAISNCLIHLAEIYHKMGNEERASELFLEAIPSKDTLGDLEGLVRSYLGLAGIYYESGSYTRSERMTDQALDIASDIRALEHVATGYGLKRDIAVARGNYRKAYEYATEYQRINDSLLDENTSRAVMEMEFRHRSKSLEQENESLRIQSTLTEELMKKRNAFMYSIAGIAILLLAAMMLGIYFLRRLRLSSIRLEEKNLVITRQNMKLDAMNTNKDRMMSIIAHDLRGTIGNQLTAIEVLQRLESKGQGGLDRKKLLGNLKHSSSYSLELLENLLHWSRLEETSSHYHPEDIKLDMIVNSCISLYDEAARMKEIRIEQNMEEGLEVFADRIMLETIIRNLLSNALKFTEAGGTVSISAVRKNGMLEFSIADSGTGMDEEQIHKILNNSGFTQRGTANEKGAGIGMTLVREFTALHGGKLNIQSRPGEGTKVVVTIPNPNQA